MNLVPAFNSAVDEYTATTTDDANKVTATPTDPDAEVEIMLGESTEVTNGGNATWGEGENVLTITVTNGTTSTEYIVTVTKSEVEEQGG